MSNRIKDQFMTHFVAARGETRAQRLLSYLTWAAAGVMLAGALGAAFGACTRGCVDAQAYLFFGFHFATIGIPFFALFAASSFGRNGRRALARNVYDILLAGILGAEWIFVGVQGRIIRHYCPVCLAIAIAVFVAVALRLVETYLRRRTVEKVEKKSIKRATMALTKSLTVIGAVYAGLILALIGISERADAGPGNITQDIWLGKADSPVEVLYVSDWYCPFCREVEPVIDGLLPEIGKVARYSFIDDPIHVESYSFLPANMSLLLNSKSRYLEGRKTLIELAGSKKSVTDSEITMALQVKGISLVLADRERLKQLARMESGFIRANGVTLTPTLIVRNNKTGALKVLVGTEQITKDQVKSAMEKILPK